MRFSRSATHPTPFWPNSVDTKVGGGHRLQIGSSLLRPTLLAISLFGLAVSACSVRRDTDQLDDRQPATTDQSAFCDAFLGGGLQDLYRIDPRVSQSVSQGDSQSATQTDGHSWSDARQLAPPELRNALEVMETQRDNVELPTEEAQQVLQSHQELQIWTTTFCNDGDPVRYFAPSRPPRGFISCGDGSWFPGLGQPIRPGWTVVYGDTSLRDPFVKPLIAVLTDARLSPGDGPSTQVFVNGAEASAGPAGVFQGTASPELAHVVSWVLDGKEVTVFGRGYTEDQIPELVAIAENVVLTDGHALLGGRRAVLPEGEDDVLYSGTNEPLISLSPLFAPARRYSNRYELAPIVFNSDEIGAGDGSKPGAVDERYGILHIEGFAMTDAQFQASQAFFAAVEPRDFHGQPGYVARAWHEAGPFVASWRYPDNTVIRIVALGLGWEPEDAGTLVTEVAEATIEHDREQWRQVSRPDLACFGD